MRISRPFFRNNCVVGEKWLQCRYLRKFSNSFRLLRTISILCYKYLLCVHSLSLCRLTSYFSYLCLSLLDDPGRYLRKLSMSLTTSHLGYILLKMLSSHTKQKITLPIINYHKLLQFTF